jgi:hypothetical protein
VGLIHMGEYSIGIFSRIVLHEVGHRNQRLK